MKFELEWGKIKALQGEEVPPSLSMHIMAKAIKVVQTIVVNQGKANVQLTLELKVTKKDKGARPSGKATRSRKGHENSNGRTFHGKGHKGKKKWDNGLSKWRPISSLNRSTWMLIGLNWHNFF
jgi:hypothetical protein